MSFKVDGVLYALNDTQQIKATFRKREFVLEYADNPTYPQFVKFEATQDRCEILDDFAVGDKVTVEFNLRGREWTNPKGEKVYFNTLDVWRVTRTGMGGGPQASAAGAPTADSTPSAGQPPLPSPEDLRSDDLPF